MLETVCPQCQQQVPQGAGRCASCQAELTPATPDPAPREIMPKWVRWGLNGTTVGLLLLNLSILLSPKTDFDGSTITLTASFFRSRVTLSDSTGGFQMTAPGEYVQQTSEQPNEVLWIRDRETARSLRAFRYFLSQLPPESVENFSLLLQEVASTDRPPFLLDNMEPLKLEILSGYEAVRWSYITQAEGKSVQQVVVLAAYHDSYFIFVQQFDPAVDGDVCIELDSILKTLRFQ